MWCMSKQAVMGSTCSQYVMHAHWINGHSLTFLGGFSTYFNSAEN